MTALPEDVARDRSFVFAFSVSIVFHVAILLLVLWQFSYFHPPVAMLDAGTGGDAVAQGAVIPTQNEETKTPVDFFPTPPIAADITNKIDIESTDSDSVLQSSPKIFTIASAGTGLIGPFPPQELRAPNLSKKSG